jgi:hypothetical protein
MSTTKKKSTETEKNREKEKGMTYFLERPTRFFQLFFFFLKEKINACENTKRTTTHVTLHIFRNRNFHVNTWRLLQ